MNEQLYPGPCVVCGLRNYPLSMGGPTICPTCDCGNSGPYLVRAQRERITHLEAEIARKDAALNEIAREQSAKTATIAADKFQSIARAALAPKGET